MDAIEADLRPRLELQRAAVAARRESTAAERRDTLRRLLAMIVDNEAAIVAAMQADFRSREEARVLGMLPTVLALKRAIASVHRWMRPERRLLSPIWGLWRTRIEWQPLGVVGIIAPWNYPMFLAVSPLVGALAAGNRAMVKLSEHTPAFADAFAGLVHATFPPEQLTVVVGGPDVAAAFARLPFDHLVFTGSTAVGREVARAAADNLVPVTLELGGKSPVIVEPGFPDAQLDTLSLGKLLNAGQSCTAPDYVLVHRDDKDRVVAALIAHVRRQFPRWGDDRVVSRIVADRHVTRLRRVIDEARARGATVHEINPASQPPEELGRRILPTIVVDPPDDTEIMTEEIFGPVLAVRGYRDLDEAIAHVKARPHPLTVFVYAHDRRLIDRVRHETQSGALCVNHTLIHFGFDELPAGGVGASGTGAYHGRDGFRRFSHARPFVRPLFNGARLLAPPWGDFYQRVMGWLLRK
jgi:acyl-CoA reductase-like NAD-dependent aldehyde dehydrogenase